MPDTPSIEPTEIIAGNTVAWTKEVSNYPAGTWVLKYYLRGPGNFTITATQSGTSSTHAVALSSAVSATYPKGKYDWSAFVTSGAERYQVASGKIEVKPDPATDKTHYDPRSPAKQILDALMAAHLENAGRPEQSYSIQAAGRSHNFYSHADLIIAINHWKAEVAREERSGQVPRILTRFR